MPKTHPLVRLTGRPRPRFPSPEEEEARRPLLEQVLSRIEDELSFMLRDTEPKELHKWSVFSLASSVPLLGWYDRAQALIDRIKAGHQPDWIRTTQFDWRFGRALCLRGDFDRLLAEPNGISLNKVISHALFQGNLALAESLIASGEDRDRPTQRLQNNGDLAILSHLLGEPDRVMPALHRARRAMEEVNKKALEKMGVALDQAFDRPLTEGADWADIPDSGADDPAGTGDPDCLYLLLVFACSGQPQAAVELAKERDLLRWPDDHNDGLAACSRLAMHGHMEQAIKLARSSVGESIPLRLLKRFVFAAVLWNQDKEAEEMLDDLLHRCSSESPEHAQDDARHVLRVLSQSLARTERQEMARRVTEAYFEACEANPNWGVIDDDAFSTFPLLTPASQARVRDSLPERLRERALRQDDDEMFGSSDNSHQAWRFCKSMATLGVLALEPEEIAEFDHMGALEVHQNLLDAGNTVDAECLLTACVAKVRTVNWEPLGGSNHYRYRVAQRLCELGRIAEGESILWLVEGSGRSTGVRLFVEALVETKGLQAGFNWVEGIEDRDARLAGWAGLLEAATSWSVREWDYPLAELIGPFGAPHGMGKMGCRC